MSRSPLEIPCCVDVPDAFVRKARYALDMLLHPLGVQARWVERDALEGGLYYGSRAAGLAPTVVRLAFSEDAPCYYAGREVYDAARATWTEWDGETWPVLFRSASDGQPDLVASAFFWLSGWQEYTVRERDQHGRFPFKASLQYRLNTAVRPVVDAYREILREHLEAGGIPVQPRRWGGKRWAFCPTVDIDMVRKWRGRRLMGELARSIFPGEGDNSSFGERLHAFREAVQARMKGGDPYVAAMKRIVDEIVGRGGTATFFLKGGAYSPYDVAYRLSDSVLTDRVEEFIGARFEIGLHPGYHAYTHAGHLLTERKRVEALSRTPLVSVRQHYLRYDGHITPKLHQAAGFRIDSTLGFSEHEGFRNGTCIPFRLYDPVADEPLSLWEMPVAAMDAALFNRRMLDAVGACLVIEGLLETVRRFGGVCVVIWHNLLWDERDHPGWGKHFLFTLEQATAGGAYVCSLQGALQAWSL